MTQQLELELSPLAFDVARDLVPLPRFWAKVAPTSSGCWIWTAAKVSGYGRFKFGEQIAGAHRLAYEWLVGPIPNGLHLDHLCRNRACVNPEHLEPVTCRENVLRGIGPSAQHAVKTHCPAGHAYDAENTYLFRGMRMCRTCRSAISAKAKRSRAAREVKSDPNDPRHGSLTAYTTYGCRCDRCRAANAEYKRGYRSRSAA